MSKLARYPAVYSRILLGIPSDGRGLVFHLADERSAHDERLRFWNFLKFLRRNPAEATHFGNRQYTTRIEQNGKDLVFRMRTNQSAQSLEASLGAALAEANVELPELPGDFPLSDIDAGVSEAIEPLPFSSSNPMDIFRQHNKDSK